MIQERLIRPSEVANRLAVSRSTVYRWFWEGRLRGIKITGGTVRILESAVTDKMAEVKGKRHGRGGPAPHRPEEMASVPLGPGCNGERLKPIGKTEIKARSDVGAGIVDTGWREEVGLRDNRSRRAGDRTAYCVYPGNHDGKQEKHQERNT
jgi:excisionase family DNA binding protein